MEIRLDQTTIKVLPAVISTLEVDAIIHAAHTWAT